MLAVVVFECANTEKHVANPVQLYPGLSQREVVNLFGMPIKAEGNPDEGNPSCDYAEHRQGAGNISHFQHRTEDELVWEYEN